MKRFLATVAVAAASAAALAQTPNTATLTWTAPTTDVNGGPIVGVVSFRIYQGPRGQPKALAATVGASPLVITSGLQSGREYCWQIGAIQTVDTIPSAESALSPEACKRFPVEAPAAVTDFTVR